MNNWRWMTLVMDRWFCLLSEMKMMRKALKWTVEHSFISKTVEAVIDRNFGILNCKRMSHCRRASGNTYVCWSQLRKHDTLRWWDCELLSTQDNLQTTACSSHFSIETVPQPLQRQFSWLKFNNKCVYQQRVTEYVGKTLWRSLGVRDALS